MSSYVQLICLVFSFCYGGLIYYTNLFNIMVINNKNILIKLILSVLYVIVMSLIYVCFLYKLNGGILHVYFILSIIVGYILFCVKKRK